MKGIFSNDLSKDFHKAFELRQSVDYRVIRPITTDRAKEIWSSESPIYKKIKEEGVTP